MTFMLVYGHEIIFKGSKEKCIKRYKDMKDPFIMELIKIARITEIRK